MNSYFTAKYHPSSVNHKTLHSPPTQPPSTHLEFDSTRTILVKDVEDVVGKLAWVAKGEELLVNLDKLLLVQLTRRAVFDEPLVPLLQLLLVDCENRRVERGEFIRFSALR
jgi:hypothetical protein